MSHWTEENSHVLCSVMRMEFLNSSTHPAWTICVLITALRLPPESHGCLGDVDLEFGPASPLRVFSDCLRVQHKV